jgi:hypothetical protein
MSILAFLFIGGLTLKGVVIVIESSIDRLSLKYDTKVITILVNAEHDNFTSENIIEAEVISNSLKPLGKQIYMHAESQKTFSA